MTQYGFSDLYTLYVFDANGQTIQMFGAFRDYHVPFNPPIYNKQWCYVPCPGHQEMGIFDSTQIYVEDKNDVVYKIIIEENKKYDRNTIEDKVNPQIALDGFGENGKIEDEDPDIIGSPHGGEGTNYLAYIAAITIGIIGCVMVMVCIYRCCVKKNTQNPPNSPNFDQNVYDAEIQALLHDQKRG